MPKSLPGQVFQGLWCTNDRQSDDSLEHLSAEEKACLLFLEETIESLDTEEDSGLSNDEPDQLPNPGNVATKLADLSASMSKSQLNSSQKNASMDLRSKKVETKPLQSYLVPTPLLVASSSPCSVPSAKLGVPRYKNSSEPHFTPPSKERGHTHNLKPVVTQVPLQVNVIPPPTKPRDCSVMTVEGPLPRGPLSYEALVHLRRSASTKKTPLCPTIDHTIDLDKNLAMRALNPTSDRSQSEASVSKRSPPVVAPKPKKIPANIPVKSITSDASYKIKHADDPQVVRLEALQKLGLLEDPEPENEIVVPLPSPKCHSSLDPTTCRITRGPTDVNPSRSPPFSYSQVHSEPKSRPLQSSASFHQCSRRDQHSVSLSHLAQTNGLKAAGLVRSATLNSHRNSGNCPEPPHIVTKPEKTTTAAQPVPPKPSNSVGYTVMVVPGMGPDRKEALRKLGLLKN